MSDHPVLKHAPITEALLDIRATLPPSTDLAKLLTLQDQVKDRFPNRQERSSLEFQFELIAGGEPDIIRKNGVQGYLFNSPMPDATKVLQARLDGFSFSKLKPYESWISFRDEAKELWSRYLDVAEPVEITRLGLRFINRIELPLPVTDFSKYLLAYPELPATIPHDVTDFLMRVVIPQPGSQGVAIVTLAREPTQSSVQGVSIIFDIDVFIESHFSPETATLWDRFEEMRSIKNDIFFNSLTEAALELFK